MYVDAQCVRRGGGGGGENEVTIHRAPLLLPTVVQKKYIHSFQGRQFPGEEFQLHVTEDHCSERRGAAFEYCMLRRKSLREDFLNAAGLRIMFVVFSL